MKRTVDVNIPLGPIHPCFKEPARLKVNVLSLPKWSSGT
jgi:Ni,Fe-hydrogenase III large subunit